MRSERAQQLARRRPVNPLPGNAALHNLGNLLPPYVPESPLQFPPYSLQAEDIEHAFSRRDESNWAQHRMQRMDLAVLPLPQLMDVVDRVERPVARREMSGQSRRSEAVNIALVDVQSREIKAIARLLRRCRLSEQGNMLELAYSLESLSVLPVHRNKGFDRVLASGLCALITREMEFLTHAIWHTQTLSVKVAFTTRVPAAGAAVLHAIITGRLRDELVAQDSLLQLDGKLSRFLPLA